MDQDNLILCDPLKLELPLCIDALVFETNMPDTMAIIKFHKFNGNRLTFYDTTDVFGFFRASVGKNSFFSRYAGTYTAKITDMTNHPIYFVSNLGLHSEIIIDFYRDDQPPTGDVIVNQNIAYICCNKTAITCGVCAGGESIKYL